MKGFEEKDPRAAVPGQHFNSCHTPDVARRCCKCAPVLWEFPSTSKHQDKKQGFPPPISPRSMWIANFLRITGLASEYSTLILTTTSFLRSHVYFRRHLRVLFPICSSDSPSDKGRGVPTMSPHDSSMPQQLDGGSSTEKIQ